mmetsp:Transcript_106280/g.342873  ORF Transcript_106280/g.342873 Transcript_106280/m.342873 type:complete len:305 (+) Transcript_106280:52-966(+)
MDAASAVTSAPVSEAVKTGLRTYRASADRLYNAANLAKLTSHSWNVFRYIGDYLHLLGIIVLLATLAKNRSCLGISRSTQILYFLVSLTRYLDLMDHSQHAYLVFFKVTYISTSAIILWVFWRLDKTYERQKDTCSLAAICIPCAVAAALLSNEVSMLEILWTFSQFLEGFAMVPQYVFCYRERGVQISVGLYVVCLGSYRVFYAANWIYKKVHMPQYSDLHSWIGGAVNGALFCDFLVSRITGCSLLRSLVLKVDEKINEIQDVVELKVLGSSRSTRSAVEGGGACELRQRRKGEEMEAPIDV